MFQCKRKLTDIWKKNKSLRRPPTFTSLVSDVRLLLLRPNHLKIRPGHPTFGPEHRRELYINRTRKTKRPRFNHHRQYSLKPEFFSLEKVLRHSRRHGLTLKNTSPPAQRLVPPQAITALTCWSSSTLSHQYFPSTIRYQLLLNQWTIWFLWITVSFQ